MDEKTERHYDENKCLWFPFSPCFRKHEDCEGCVIFWRHDGKNDQRLLYLVYLKDQAMKLKMIETRREGI